MVDLTAKATCERMHTMQRRSRRLHSLLVGGVDVQIRKGRERYWACDDRCVVTVSLCYRVTHPHEVAAGAADRSGSPISVLAYA